MRRKASGGPFPSQLIQKESVTQMNKIVSLIAAALLFAAAAAATEFPRYETYLGYDWVKFNPASGNVPSFNANGGSGQFVYNFNGWLGLAVDAGAVTKGVLNHQNLDTTIANLVAGPRLTWHRESRFRPFGEVLFGGTWGTTSTQIPVLPVASPAIIPPGLVVSPDTPISARLQASRSGFAMLTGGGLDIKVGKHTFFRLFEADYYLTRVPTFVAQKDINRNNFRYSTGVNFVFGGAK